MLSGSTSEEGLYMIDSTKINELVSKLAEALPPGVKQIPEDIEKTFRTVLQSGFAKMDLVTREEFDAQSKVLARTREKLELLEKRMNDLDISGKSGE
jgi:ubiquinone biosynthesis accessory factor UbiK